MKRLLRRLGPLIALAVVVSGWWLAVRIFDIRPLLLPAPPEVIAAYARPGNISYLLREAAVTVGQTMGGFAIAAVVGLTAAMAMTAFRVVRESVMPLIAAAQAVPKVALAPLLIMWFGWGAGSKIALVVLLSFFPILVASMAGLAATPADLGELARSLSASRWQAYRRFRLPWALPQIFVGLRLGAVFALIGAVVAQITTPNAGLGSVVVLSGQYGDTALAFAAIGLLAATGIVLYYLINLVERLLLPWSTPLTTPPS